MGLFSSSASQEVETKDMKDPSDAIKGPELFDGNDFQTLESFNPSFPVLVVCGNGETFVGRFEGKDFIMRPIKIESGDEEVVK